MLNDDDFAEFIESRGTALLRTATFLVGRDDAEDLLQLALVNTYSTLRRLREPQALEAYVRKTMVRAAIAASRTGWRRREWSTDAVPDSRQPGEATTVEDRGELWPLLRQLSAQQRAVTVLRYYEDMSEADIADHLGCSAGSVKRHASRALDRLRRSLAEQALTTQGGAPDDYRRG